MNKLQLLATITRNIEIKYTQSGTTIASFGVAYNEKRKQQDGSYADQAHFFDITAFGKTAENLNQYFRKGSRILIDGSLDFQSWTAQDGQKRSKVGIKLHSFNFIDRKADAPQQPQPQNNYSQPTQERPASQPQGGTFPSIDVNQEIPFKYLDWRL